MKLIMSSGWKLRFIIEKIALGKLWKVLVNDVPNLDSAHRPSAPWSFKVCVRVCVLCVSLDYATRHFLMGHECFCYNYGL